MEDNLLEEIEFFVGSEVRALKTTDGRTFWLTESTRSSAIRNYFTELNASEPGGVRLVYTDMRRPEGSDTVPNDGLLITRAEVLGSDQGCRLTASDGTTIELTLPQLVALIR
jgi:hypothetical protein